MGIAETVKSSGQLVRSLVTRAAQELASHIGDSSQMFVVLTVRPLFRASETVVSLQLSTNVGQAEADDDPAEQAWEVPYSLFEAGTSDDADAIQGLPELKVPEQLAAGLRYRLALKQVPAGKPLWLKLARPYGVLGTVPWESELNAALGCPVLRLPDYPARPVERPDILESAIIVDADANADTADVARRVQTLVDATLARSSRTVTRTRFRRLALVCCAQGPGTRQPHRRPRSRASRDLRRGDEERPEQSASAFRHLVQLGGYPACRI